MYSLVAPCTCGCKNNDIHSRGISCQGLAKINRSKFLSPSCKGHAQYIHEDSPHLQMVMRLSAAAFLHILLCGAHGEDTPPNRREMSLHFTRSLTAEELRKRRFSTDRNSFSRVDLSASSGLGESVSVWRVRCEACVAVRSVKYCMCWGEFETCGWWDGMSMWA